MNSAGRPEKTFAAPPCAAQRPPVVPLAKARIRKRMAAAEDVGDAKLVAELFELLAQIESVFPD